MKNLVFIMLGALGLCAQAYCETPAVGFEKGQVWSFSGRTSDPNPRLKIVTIDRFEGGMVIYHISLLGLKLANSMAESGMQESIPHLAVQESTLRSSVVELLEEDFDVPADFSEGYRNFYEALGNQEAGIWQTPLDEMLDLLEESVADTENLDIED